MFLCEALNSAPLCSDTPAGSRTKSVSSLNTLTYFNRWLLHLQPGLQIRVQLNPDPFLFVKIQIRVLHFFLLYGHGSGQNIQIHNPASEGFRYACYLPARNKLIESYIKHFHCYIRCLSNYSCTMYIGDLQQKFYLFSFYMNIPFLFTRLNVFFSFSLLPSATACKAVQTFQNIPVEGSRQYTCFFLYFFFFGLHD